MFTIHRSTRASSGNYNERFMTSNVCLGILRLKTRKSAALSDIYLAAGRVISMAQMAAGRIYMEAR